ncbi:MAG: hypothetical protein AVDCRST_MAG29-1361, partial [uncultured Nocardioidaceae bacterium]
WSSSRAESSCSAPTTPANMATGSARWRCRSTMRPTGSAGARRRPPRADA